MPRREKFVPGQIYHVLNRGVDKRKIFLDDRDYLRAVHNLFEFNDNKPVFNFGRKNLINPPIDFGNQSRERLVDVLAFCFMSNHFHFLLRPKEVGGLELFLRKFSVGYANYFNKKYQRAGALFQGRYKSILVNQENHFIHLPFYIHFNPLDLKFPEWRKRELKNYKKAIEFLESYRWSSYLDYIGEENFPSVTQREFLLNFFEGPKKYKEAIERWLKEASIQELEDVSLE